MDFEIPDETRVLIDTVRRFVETEVQPLEDEVEELGRVPTEKLNAVKVKAQALGL